MQACRKLTLKETEVNPNPWRSRLESVYIYLPTPEPYAVLQSWNYLVALRFHHHPARAYVIPNSLAITSKGLEANRKSDSIGPKRAANIVSCCDL